jgi:exopolyphosphatase/guanosine-5'-triphosphate,3'-diphosphate pyrophosphatase
VLDSQSRPEAPGRIRTGEPIAVIDIGSNSVRLVVYEQLSRSPTQLFNEKVFAGLGRGIATTGRLRDDSIEAALSALRRFRVVMRSMEVGNVKVIATAAPRDAENGPDFLSQAEAVCGAPIELLSGKREARLSAYGVVAGTYKPDGIVGDLGGGSLELIDIHGHRVGGGVTLPLGALRLQETAGQSIKEADRVVREAMADAAPLAKAERRAFYAVGGTWRAFARLHMRQRGYPLNVMHGYAIPARDALEFARLVRRVTPETLDSIDAVASGRRPLLAYGALVLEHLIRRAKPSEIVISAMGVREGLLYEMLDEAERREDPLIFAARELGYLRSRSPEHSDELVAWTDRFFASTGLDETAEEKRLRRAACYLSDIGWRAHPDYRGEQSLNIIAHAAFAGIDHPGRAFLALTVFYRHIGIVEDTPSPRLRELASTRMIDRARILGAALRVAYLVSAAMPGTLSRTPLVARHGACVLSLPPELADLASERLANRLKQLSRLIGREGRVGIEG